MGVLIKTTELSPLELVWFPSTLLAMHALVGIGTNPCAVEKSYYISRFYSLIVDTRVKDETQPVDILRIIDLISSPPRRKVSQRHLRLPRDPTSDDAQALLGGERLHFFHPFLW